MITRKMLQSVVAATTTHFYQPSKLLQCSRRNFLCVAASQHHVPPAGRLSVVSLAHQRYIVNHIVDQHASITSTVSRFYSNIHRKEIDLKVAKGKKLITETIETKRINLQQRKAILVQELRDKKTKVKEKVKEMEEIVERENILTIPNLLCVGRAVLAPYVGYVIVQGDYKLAIGLLVIAGVTDLVCYICYLCRRCGAEQPFTVSFLHSWMV